MKQTVMINLCRLLIIVPWLIIGSAAYAAIDPTELAVEVRCGSGRTTFFGDTIVDIKVSVIVPTKYDLADQKIADEVVSAAHTKALNECPRPPEATRRRPQTRRFGPRRKDTKDTMSGRNGKIDISEEGHAGGDRTCFFKEEKLDCPGYLYKTPNRRRLEQEKAASLARQQTYQEQVRQAELKAQTERAATLARQQAAAEQRRRSELEAQARLDQKTQAFADQHGVNGGWVNWQQLRANPFSYDGKTLLFIVRFDRMISPTSGLFNGMMVTELPNNAFLEPKVVVLVAKVTGASEIKNALGGTEQVPQATYVSHAFCEQQNCGDYAGRLR